MTFGTRRGWGCQPHAPAAFTPRKCSWHSFSLGAESTPGPWFGRKNPVTLPGIDPGTVRLVAQHLDHYATPGPLQGISGENYVQRLQKHASTRALNERHETAVTTRDPASPELKILAHRQDYYEQFYGVYLIHSRQTPRQYHKIDHDRLLPHPSQLITGPFIPPADTKQRLLTALLKSWTMTPCRRYGRKWYQRKQWRCNVIRPRNKLRRFRTVNHPSQTLSDFLPSETQAHTGKWKARTKRPYDTYLKCKLNKLRRFRTVNHPSQTLSEFLPSETQTHTGKWKARTKRPYDTYLKCKLNKFIHRKRLYQSSTVRCHAVYFPWHPRSTVWRHATTWKFAVAFHDKHKSHYTFIGPGTPRMSRQGYRSA